MAEVSDTSGASAPVSKAKTVKLRLLIDSSYGNADDVVALPADIAKQLQAQGIADSNKDAVFYALSLPQNQTPA